MINKNNFIKILIFLTSVILLILLIFAYDYIVFNYNIGVPCVINKCFGVYCPGCGMTRAVDALLKLDFKEAFKYNVFSIILFPILFIVCVIFIWNMIFKGNKINIKYNNVLLIILATCLLLYGILRNFIPILQP